jgi:hypothetical protein
MIQFRRRPIGETLIDEICMKARSGQSCVVLGPRYGGKRHVLRSVRDTLIRSLGSLLIYSDSPNNLAQSHDIWLDGVQCAEIGLSIELADRFFEEFKKPVNLMLANVDSLAHCEARKLLSEVQSRVEARRLVAILAGECNLRDLVRLKKLLREKFQQALALVRNHPAAGEVSDNHGAKCTKSCGAQKNSEKYLCPAGFWGLSKVLEWQSFRQESARNLKKSDYLLQALRLANR